MADKPILFSGPMVRAILEGRKSQTRRVLDMPSMYFDAVFNDDGAWHIGDALTGHHYAKLSVRYRVGDRVYVREAWRTGGWLDGIAPRDLPQSAALRYEADSVDPDNLPLADGRFRQAMHMPRWASRLTLIVTNVRVQRLQEISEADARDEGCPCQTKEELAGMEARGWFRDLWDSLNAKRGFGWDTNPWVAAYTFETVHQNIDVIGGGNA